MITIAEVHAEDFDIEARQATSRKDFFDVVVRHSEDEIWSANFNTKEEALGAWQHQVKKYLPDRAANMFAQATIPVFTADDADDRELDSCYCSTTHPPCSFCTSLDEDEADVYGSGGSELLRQYRAAKLNGDPWPPYSDNPLYGAF